MGDPQVRRHQPRYRQASQRVAADIASAPGFGGLADSADRLVASSHCDPLAVDAKKV